MVQVIVDGRDLESVRQFEDLFDVVEPVVILDDEPISDSFRKAAEILFEPLKCFFFITVDAADMQDDFVVIVGAETLSILSWYARSRIARATTSSSGEFSTVYWPGWKDTRMPLFWIFAPMRSKASLWISGQSSVLTGLEPNGIRSELMRNSRMSFCEL